MKKCGTPKVLQVNCPPEVTLFHRTTIPADLGDDIAYPPKAGLYRNALVVYEANGHTYMYSSDGIPTFISDGTKGTIDYEKLINKPQINSVELIGDVSLEDLGITDLVDDEAEAREQADTELQNAIDAEESARIAADNDIISRIPVVNDATLTIQKNGSTVATFTANDADNVTADIAVPTKTSDITNDSGFITNTVNDLTNYYTKTESDMALSNEATTRANADLNLQEQIDAISSSSDVVDVVGTYAELQAYDTSKLHDNDIIKVLTDETHDDAISYYRWNATDSDFDYIGSQGPFYTKSETDATFVPQTRTVNNKALSSNITLTAADVGALPDSTVIPTVNNATLTIQKNGTNVQTFTANQATNATANITVPVDTSDLNNDGDGQSPFDTEDYVDTYGGKIDTIEVNGTAQPIVNKTVDITVPTKTSDLANDSDFPVDANYVHTDNNYTTADKNKLAGIAAGAEVNVQSDWNESDNSSDAYIKNKPSIPDSTSDLVNDSGYITNSVNNLTNYYKKSETYTKTEVDGLIPTKTSDLTNDGADGTSTYVEADDLATVATSGSYNDLSNKPTIPAAQVNSDWNASSGVAQILNKPSLATVATSGSYNDLSNKPTIPAAQVNSDWDASSGVAQILNKPNLATVATSGSYNDLTDKPNISLVEMSYGESNAWAKFIAAYQSGKIVYCRASSNSNPASGSQTRKAFMAYVNNAENPTEVEFQYVRSVSTKTSSQPVDQVFVYKLTSASGGTWTVQTRDMGPKLAQGTNTTVSYSNGTYTISATQPTVPTKTSDLTNDGSDGTSTYVEADDLATVATTGSYNDLVDKPSIPSGQIQSDWAQTNTSEVDYIKNKPTIPTVGNATLTIQKNGTSAGTFTANATSNKTINITVPTTAADVSALPASTKYGASIAVSINTTDYKVTTTLKDQDGNTLGTAQVIDLPLESVVVSGSYDSTNKKIVLTLQNGNTIDIPVADLVAGLQSEITSTNKLASDLVDDTNQTHKFVTSAQITKLNGIATGAEVNQNAFSNVKVGSTTVAADAKTDTLELVAGSNVTLTPDATNDKVTIAATDTTYSDATTSAHGLMSAADKTKLNGIATGAEVNVQSDWNQTTTTADDYIKNKPTIPTVNNATLTITQNGTSAGTFTANASSNKTIALTDTTYSAGTNIDITSNTIKTKTLGVEYIIGTQSASTNAWTGVSTDTGCSSSTIYTGKVIVYHLPYAGTNSAATLNLTLPDGTTTGAKGVKYNTGSNVGTTYGAGCDIFMVFDGSYWKCAPWYDSNNYDRIRHNTNVKAASAVTAGQIIVGTDAGYKPVANGVTFSINYPILYAGSAIAAAATGNNNYDAYPGVNLQNTKSGYTGTTYKMVFLVGTLSGTTFTVNSDILTQTIPSSADSKVYAPIGLMTDSNKTVYFFPTNNYWEYRNGAFRPISTCPTLATVATSGSYNDLSNKPTIPAAQVQSNWTQTTTTAVDYIKNKPTLATVATSGSYNDLSNKPTIPTVNNATLTIQKNGTTVKTFTANASSNVTANITVPTKTSEITNDSNFVASGDLATVATSGSYNDLSNKPTIPTVNNATLTIQKNGTNVQTFTANQSTNATANITVPTKISDLTNTSGGFITYCTCSTAAATAAKVVTLDSGDSNWVLRKGAIIGVKFTNSNTASSVTLNVNSSGAKSIYYNNAAYTGSSNSICGYASRYTFYMYDGTYWVWISDGRHDGNDNTYTTAYCSTAAGTAAKAATMTGYTLTANRYTVITFTNANSSASALTLNINSKGAKPLYINGAASSATNYTLAAGSYIVYYDGTNYYINNNGEIPRMIHSESPVSTSSVTPIVTNSMISNGTIRFDKTYAGDFLQITLQTNDPGANSPLAKNCLIGVYE